MIKSFRHKGLADFFLNNIGKGVRQDLHKRCASRLAALDNAETLDDLRFPGWDLHPLHTKPSRQSFKVNGPWRITFEWRDGDAHAVDLEQYH
ncbi:MAG: type II toxin-antitoxin system RelE/ParE family toxin [Pseudomonadales bacterium]|nr:type II toxin-antitoxin system RelE/ParE family toxin [Pseudomonadales bacterium]